MIDVDKKYFYGGDDLGAVWNSEQTVFKVWAPLADKARIQLYKTCTDEKPFRKLPMTKDKTGVWSKTAFGNLDGVYYTYVITYDEIETETIDVYARSCGANGAMGFIFNPETTNPKDWEQEDYVSLPHYTDASIYELHVRDFSIDKDSIFCYRGRFLAFIEKHLRNSGGDKIGLSHLRELGITHVQLQPIFDFQTVDETDLRRPQFNWGYDPQNFNCPEGSYSTDPYNGRTRVLEMKRMIQMLHRNGIGVIMDVVYNHTYATADSAFTKTFPKYYYRQWGDHYANGSGCGNEVATERPMVRKYIIDSLCYFMSEYKIDGFRFDLMGLYDVETLKIAEEKLRAINPSVILYGEGWTGGDSPLEYSKRAMKLNARAVPGYGFFSDDFRDTIKGNNFVNKDKGYVNGAIGTEHFVREVISGRIPHPQLPGMSQYSWTDTPCQTVNYVEAHDNLTLWDKLFYSNPTDTEENRKRMDKLAAAFVFLSQGIPFIQAGQDFLRSKPLPGGNSFDHNSYNSPDIINSIKWDRKTRYRDVFNYYKGLIEFRKNHSALRMYENHQVAENLKFFDNLPARIIGFGLYGDDKLSEILVFFNAGEFPVKLYAFEEYDVYIDGETAGDVSLRKVSGEYEIEGISVIVLGKNKDG
ncbi:MAG: type I pullulanase [Ruminococcus sp.]|jgi:pullulanase|nr:type I pullulanase [Ruminococcus sp.]